MEEVTKILQKEYQDYINLNLKSDPVRLLLSKSPFSKCEMKVIIEQINAKRRCEKKLPTWFATQRILFPNKLNVEQTSSETTARHKASLVSGSSIADLTGGFGVDCFYFAQSFKSVTHMELNETLSQKVKHNFEVLKIDNVNCICGDGIELSKSQKFDWIYIDPSRRSDSKGKVFLLSDCLPNVPEYIDSLLDSAGNILIKVSPMLDITQGIKELKFVKEVHVVAVKNEVKELLFVIEKGFEGNIIIHSTQLGLDSQPSTLSYSTGDSPSYKLGDVAAYLYEPNASVMKTQGFNYWSQQFDLFKLNHHTHIFTSDLLFDFPGRRFKVLAVTNFNKKGIKKLYGKKSFNVISRNFPKSVAQIRSEFNIIDQDGDYLFFISGIGDKKMVIEAELILSDNLD